MNPKEFYRTVSSLLDPQHLGRKRVAVIGLGSGGCRVAAELGRLGVHLLLVERANELLEEHNIGRHLLGYESLGKAKVSGMVGFIHNLNPSTRIKTCELDVVSQLEQLKEVVGRWKPDLIAVCTDNEPSKHAINEVALGLDAPQVGGAVYDGGIGGEVYRVRRGQACYGCLATQLRLERQAPKEAALPNYGTSQLPDPPAITCLNLDIAQIALLQCRFILDILLEPMEGLTGLPSNVNLCIFSNRVVPGLFSRPWHGEFLNVARRRECLSCGENWTYPQPEANNILSAFQDSP